MTPATMAQIYARAFPDARPWSADEITGLLDSAGGFCVAEGEGFAIGRALVGEAELMTLAVDPTARRRGTGRALVAGFEAAAHTRGAQTAFLEVAADNAPALALYTGSGWVETGRRRGYYARTGGAIDAIVMTKALA